ncbi:MAG: ABC transporter ATP-binding protein [Candidatus Aminicenantes bacterium]|nr:ABC transporter ATP-binding protein [Candidatus Aminicenantes bacterium]
MNNDEMNRTAANAKPTKSAVAIKITGLKKKFGAFTAVDGLSFDIYKGEIFGFLGPNGAGKTTTINMICGLSKPSQGEIFIFEKRIKDENDIKTQIGICPQENIHWPKLTCLEQLVFMGEIYDIPGKAAKNRARELLMLLGLAEKAGVPAAKLSGGMKRRLNICLALVHDPKLLVLDEPEAGLDPQSRILVRDFIKTLAKEKTIILTTHNMDEAERVADRVAIIDHGKLLLLDTPDNLKKSIGEGDILEIQLDTDRVDHLGKLADSLLSICDNVKTGGSTLVIKSKNLIESVSEITAKIKEQGFKIKEIKLRENTLEDVFIYLTGRKLRQ